MICAVRELDDLQHHLNILNLNTEEIQTRQSRKLLDGNSVEFYTIWIPEKKINIANNDCTLEELREHFTMVNSSLLEKVWKEQQTWTSCFDVLNSLINSNHGMIIIDHCEFIFNHQEWPTLLESLHGNSYRYGNGHFSDNNSSHGDWSVISMNSINSITISLSDAKITNSNYADDHSSSKSVEEDWEVLSGVSVDNNNDLVTTNNTITNSNHANGNTIVTISAQFPVSYRDILLKPTERDEDTYNDNSKRYYHHRDEEPRKVKFIVIEHIPRIRADRVYMNSINREEYNWSDEEGNIVFLAISSSIYYILRE